MLAENVLRKHVAIIHAYSMMSSLQRKIFNVLLHRAMESQSFHEKSESIAIECVMSLKELKSAVNFNSHNTKYLKESIDALASLTIEWNLLRDRVPTTLSFLNLRVLHGSPTFLKDGTFNFSFHKIMLDFIGNPDIYGTIDIDLQAKFESKYGHSLYENSTRFVNMQKGKIIQLDTFRKLLGVGAEKHLSMRELTRSVINPAIEEVNDRAGFVVELNQIRVGARVNAFHLIVNPKQDSRIISSPIAEEADQKILNEILNKFGKINGPVLENIFKKYDHEYINQKILYTVSHAQKDKQGFYPAAYFISALKFDYQSNEKGIEESVTVSKVDVELQRWHEKLRELRSDLSGWENNLKATNGDSPSIVPGTINTIISQCKESLEKHLLSHPKKKSHSEAV